MGSAENSVPCHSERVKGENIPDYCEMSGEGLLSLDHLISLGVGRGSHKPVHRVFVPTFSVSCKDVIVGEYCSSANHLQTKLLSKPLPSLVWEEAGPLWVLLARKYYSLQCWTPIPAFSSVAG